MIDRCLLRCALLAASAASAQCAYRAPLQPAAFGGRDVSLRYEGTCAHLACCSTYAVAVPAQRLGAFHCEGHGSGSCRQHVGWFTPAFTCDPRAQGRYRQPGDAPFYDCRDEERWLAIPGITHAQCGESYLVCRNGVRVTAVVRDRSASNDSGKLHYEGSQGLWRAVGADPSERETFVSIYPLYERDLIAADPHCVGSGR